MKYCKNCEQNVTPEKDFSWAILLLGSVLTGGLMLLFYPLYYWLLKTPNSCPICNSSNWKQ